MAGYFYKAAAKSFLNKLKEGEEVWIGPKAEQPFTHTVGDPIKPVTYSDIFKVETGYASGGPNGDPKTVPLPDAVVDKEVERVKRNLYQQRKKLYKEYVGSQKDYWAVPYFPPKSKAQMRAEAAEWLTQTLYKLGNAPFSKLLVMALDEGFEAEVFAKAVEDLGLLVELPGELHNLMAEQELREVLEPHEKDGLERPPPQAEEPAAD